MFTEDLLKKLFKPVRVLVVGRENSAIFQALRSLCACEIDVVPVRGRYDVVLVDLSSPTVELVGRLKHMGPVALVGARAFDALDASMAGAVLLLPNATEQVLADLFRVLKIKTRTPELQRELASLAPASGKSFAESACAKAAA